MNGFTTNNVLDSSCFIAFIDIMGFKNKLQSDGIDETYNDLIAIQENHRFLDTVSSVEPGNRNKFQDQSYFFSDSIVIYTVDDTFHSLMEISMHVSDLLVNSFKIGVPLNGGIAHGLMKIDKEKNIFLGQPLINSYEIQSELLAYCIVFHSSVDKYLDDTNPENIQKELGESELSEFVTNNDLKIFRRLLCIEKLPFKFGSIYCTMLKLKFKSDNNDIILRIKKLRATSFGRARLYIDNSIDIYTKFENEYINESVNKLENKEKPN